MERVLRVDITDTEDIDALNDLFDKGWRWASMIPYRGKEFLNQYLFVLGMPDDEHDNFKFDRDEEDDFKEDL